MVHILLMQLLSTGFLGFFAHFAILDKHLLHLTPSFLFNFVFKNKQPVGV